MATHTTPGDQARLDVAGKTTGSVFDTVVDRKNFNSMKWAYAHQLLAADEAAADPLPMWVADTDFKAPQAVIDALHQAVDHGAFGYPGGATDSYLDAVTGWQARRFGWEVPREWVLQTAGIITTLRPRCRHSPRRAIRS
ncbi:hypothetical protein [Streptomyces sp. ME19-01-6]|uniref:hypothetical protein n=1 Tax=Streptomyces sp. ME19-01-6 TaxID=3028686 RepID=UPI0029AF68FF|nr:hypothetical protein [Streptomyces sp. ME19-01-6]MDX3225217.1 hypothetical protein [Streptomyces sp. ME19-01-6]